MIYARGSHVNLLISQKIQLDKSRWNRFTDRLVLLPWLEYLPLLGAQADADINIAPLELGYPFTEAKSQLKVFEAGLVKVPTITSPTASMKLAVNHGVDGMLAATSNQWRSTLSSLIENKELRVTMGERARERTLREFSVPAILPLVEKHYGG